MNKQTYITPALEIIVMEQHLMDTTSPGISSSEYDPDKDPVESKEGRFDIDWTNEDFPEGYTSQKLWED